MEVGRGKRSLLADHVRPLRPVQTTILHGLQDTVILPEGSRDFVRQLLTKAPTFPIDLHLIPGDHRLSSPEHVDLFRRLVLDSIQ